ncbi:treacle protein isoform X4 [Pogona vitticeps]
MAAAGSEQQQELLALMHQHLVQTGYERAAKALLQQSGRKTFPSSPVSLQDIFAQWKKTYSQVQKQKVDDTKKSIPAKIRVSDPRSSSESSDEEEAANAVKNKTNLPVNNISVAKAETSSEDEDSSSEEEAVAGKVVKTPGTGNKTTDCLQLAAQKTNSFPGKGVAVAAVQAKERQKKAAVSKPLPPSVGRQNKAPSGQQGAALPSLGVQRQTRVQAAAAKKTASSENSSSNSSSSTESEEEKTLATVKLPPPKSDLKKAESSSEDSSDDSDSEEESQAATVQAKPGVPSTQVSSALAKSSPATIALSKASTVKVPPAKVKANQVSTGAGSASKTAEATDSSDTSDSSDSEDEEPSSAAQTKLPGKAGQASASLAKSAASNQTSDRGACASAPMKQTPKPPITSLAKLSTPAKKAGSSESSGSSSESENEAPPVPVSQKAKPGVPSTQVSSTLAKSSPATIAPSKASAVKVPPAKVKANQVGTGAGTAARTAESTDSSDTSDSSDSEDEEPSSAAQTKLPGKAGQASASLAKSAASNQTSDRGACASAPMKQTPKPPITSLAKLSTPAKKAGSSESSGSSSETENEAPPIPVSQKAKPGVPSTQVSSTLAKSSPATIALSKASAVKVPPAKVKANQVSTGAGTAARTAESTDSSGSSDSSDSEDEEPSSAAQTKLPGKSAQASIPLVEHAASNQMSDRETCASTPMKQTPKPPITSLAKLSTPAKKAGSSESSGSSSESENEAPPIPVSQKRLQGPQAPTGTKPNQDNKPGSLVKAAPSALKAKGAGSDSSSTSDSEDDVAPAALKLPPLSATKANIAGAPKPQPVSTSLQEAQQSEDSSQDSSDESDSKEGTVFTQPPIHPFFKQMVGKGATSSAKSTQANASTSSAISSQRQELGTAATGKVERSPSKKARPSQNQDPIVLLKRLDSVESRSSLDSQEGEEKVKTAVMTTKQIPQPGVPQKQGAIKEAESSSEDSSDDEEPSQSLLAGSSGPSKTPAYTALKNTSSMPLKQSSGKAGASVPSTLAKTSGKPAFAGISSGDSSDSETDVEEIVGTKAEVSTLPSSGKGTVVAKVGKEATVEKKGPGSKVPKASKAKKTTAKAQSNGKAKEAPAVQIRLTSWSKAQPAQVASESKEEAAAQILAAGGQEEAGAAPAVAGKTPKAAKASKSGEKKKVSKKRKLATGDASLGETKGKKLKTQSNPEAVTKKKKKKKKKSKTPGDTKTPKKKEGKEKKADKKKKKSKKMESLSEDGLQKKKKKKKKSGDLEGTA